MTTIDPTTPRVLVISGVPFCQENATGITMSNMFARWPHDKLALLYIARTPDRSICDTLFQLGEWRWFLLSYLARPVLSKRWRRLSTEVPGAAVGAPHTAPSPLAQAHRFIRLVNEFVPVFAMGKVHDFIRRFQPEVIYTTLGSMKLVRFVTAIARRYALPVVAHFYDDWPAFFYSDGYLGGMPQRALQQALTALFRYVPRGLCIGEEMAEEYTTRYQIPFSPMMNCIDDALFDVAESTEHADSLVMTYIGGLHLNRWKSLCEIARCTNGQCLLKIFAPPDDIRRFAEAFAEFPHVQLGSLTPDQTFAEMKRADVLIHVESFDEDTIAYARVSVSTKIPQYMAARRPILAYGPGALASMRVIQRAHAGVAVTAQQADALNAAVQLLLGNARQREEWAESGYAYARRTYAQSVTSAQLREVLRDAVNRRHAPNSNRG